MALTPTGHGVLSFRKIEWDTPHAIYRKIDEIFAYHTSMRDFFRKERREIINSFHKSKSWVETVISWNATPSGNSAECGKSQRVGVRGQSYLIAFPWSFLSALLNSEATAKFKNQLSIVSAFSYASLKRAEESEAHPIRQPKLAVFLDPLEDLPEVRCLANHVSSMPGRVQTDLFLGTRVTAPRILEYLRHADCIVYIGHGRQVREKETTGIICSYGKEVRDVDIERTDIRRHRTTRVAVIMACWGGASAVKRSIHSWESQGLPYSLKQSGFDYIVTSLWPVSPRIAASFVEYFLSEWSQERAIAASVSMAYQRLIKKYGIETVMIEGSGIQLIA